MKRAGVMIYGRHSNGSRISYKLEYQSFEEVSRASTLTLIQNYIKNNFGENPSRFENGERKFFAFEADDGGNIDVWKGDLADFQAYGLSSAFGMRHIRLAKEQLDLLMTFQNNTDW